jgi:predicted acylesterase/phospholipase RssA
MTRLIKTLGLASGGLRGIYHIAVLKEMENMNIIKDITKYVGCSIGSLICALYIIGFSPDEIMDMVYEFNVSSMFDISAENIIELPKKFGLCNGIKYGEFIKECFCKKGCNPYITFAQFHEKYKTHLLITSANVSQHTLSLLDYINTPDLPVWLGIRMSCAIPLLFQPIKWEGDYYADGVLIGDLPLGMVDDPDSTVIFNLFDDVDPSDLYAYICCLIRCVQHESWQYAKSHYPDSTFVINLSYTDFMSSNFKTVDKTKTENLIKDKLLEINGLLTKFIRDGSDNDNDENDNDDVVDVDVDVDNVDNDGVDVVDVVDVDDDTQPK